MILRFKLWCINISREFGNCLFVGYISSFILQYSVLLYCQVQMSDNIIAFGFNVSMLFFTIKRLIALKDWLTIFLSDSGGIYLQPTNTNYHKPTVNNINHNIKEDKQKCKYTNFSAQINDGKYICVYDAISGVLLKKLRPNGTIESAPQISGNFMSVIVNQNGFRYNTIYDINTGNIQKVIKVS